MIFDELQNMERYAAAVPLLSEAVRFLRDPATAGLAIGRYEFSGGAYALVQEYMTKDVKAARWEAHRTHIDVQFVASGEEKMGRGPLSALEGAGTYDETNDAILADRVEGGSEFIVGAGSFAVFFPEDVHRPCLAVGSPGRVRKVVVKLPVRT
jgi:YhcH/YjgK/YiaL family protein